MCGLVEGGGDGVRGGHPFVEGENQIENQIENQRES